MVGLQWSCLAILFVHMGVAWWVSDRREVFLRRALLLVGASWVAEDTCIRAYQFYTYNEGWWGFIDKMPLMIAVIWPGVILSAWELVRAAQRKTAHALPSATHADSVRTGWLVGLMVWADASLIEPIAVKARLWWWYEPGIFNVPIIGMLGWGIFAGLCVWIFEEVERRRLSSGWEAAGVLVAAPLLAHAGLLATWWGGFRWVNVPWSESVVVGVLWVGSVALALKIWRARLRDHMPAAAMGTRIPAASFFMGLLVMYGMGDGLLVVHALAFVPPYVAATPWRALWARRFGRFLNEHQQSGALPPSPPLAQGEQEGGAK